MEIKMKKSFLICSLIFLSLTLNAAEWGGAFSNVTEFAGKTEELKLVQNDGLSLWGKIPCSKDNNSYLLADVSYNFKYDAQDSANRAVSNILNLNLFEANFYWKLSPFSRLQLKAGRFPIADGTGAIFTQSADGLYLNFKSLKVEASVYGSYTGLLNSKVVEMLPLEDFGYKSNYIEETNDFYTLSAKYIPVALNLRIPFRAQNFVLQGWGFLDLNESNANRFLATVGFNGYISKNLSYNVQTSFQTVNFASISNFSKVNFSLYVKNFILSLKGIYASGNNGSFSPFIAVTKKTPVFSLYDTEYSGLILAGLEANYLVKKIVNVFAGADFIIDARTENLDYRGFQYAAGLNYNIFPDLRLSAIAKQFFGKNTEENKLTLDIVLQMVF